MQIYVLSQDPEECARLLTIKMQRKMLVEQMQLMSTYFYKYQNKLYKEFMYKPINSGKELVDWIGENLQWNFIYLQALVDNVIKNNSNKWEGYKSIKTAMSFLNDNSLQKFLGIGKLINITNVSFRCKKEYCKHEEYNKKTLDIEHGLLEYKQYWKWNLKNYNLGD